MDILRLIIRLPFLIAGIIYGFLWALFGFLSFLFKPIIGDISWECPLWLSMLIRGGKRLETFSERHPKAIAAGTLGVIVAGFAAYATYLWVESRPRPIEVAPIGKNEIVAEVRAPMATDYTQEPLSFPRLQLRFSESAAPTEKIGKAITEGIVLLPEKKGTWQWSDDQTLTFTPEDDWKIEEPYKITLETQKLLAEQVTLHQTVYTFNTAPFTVSVPESELYQNPDKPSEKNAVFKVKFSHPVDAASFEKRVGLSLQTVEKQHTLNKSFPFAIKYDQKKLTAWVRSGLVTLPDVDSEMKLTIAEGVTSTLPGKAGKTKVSMAQTVLGAYQNIVKNIEPTFAENDRNEVTQILAVSLMDAVNPKTFAPHIKAWVFPENYNRLYINEDALQDAIPLSLELENPSTAESTLAFKYKADPKRYIYVKVDKDIETVGGYKAKSASYFATSVPHFPQVLRFANQGAVLPLIGDKKIGVLARGLNGVQLEIKRVIPNQLHHLFPMSWDDQFAKKHFDSIAGQENHFVERFTVNRSLDNASPVKSQYIGFNLSDFLLKKGKHGVFLLSLNAWDAKNNKVTGIGFDNKLVIVTDLGLITKEATDKSLDVFVQSIHQNKPKKGVSVSVVAQNGSTLVSGKTNDEGHIAFPSLAHYRYEQTPAMVLADDNGDISLLPAYFYTGDRELDFSRFDVGGADNETRAGKLNAYVFSDRGLYRPGDRVNIGMIVRAESWSIPVGGVPLKVTVYDPRGETFGESFIEVDKTGFNEFNFTTPDSAPTGDWIISLSLARDTRKGGYVNSEYTTLGTGKVSVREFTPDRMKVQLVFQGDTTQGWVKPEALKATLLAHNLFGTPAQNRVVTSKLIAQPTQFIFKEFAGYSFYDAAYHPDRQFEITLENTKTDAEGKAPLALHLEEHERASYRLSIFAEAFEAGAGRGVATTQSVYVSPNDYMIGAKPDGETAYINQKDKRALHFIAVNPDLRTRALEGLTIDLIEKKYVSVLTLQDSGIYKYQSKLREIPVRSEPLAIAQGGTNVALDTQKPGLYMLVVKNDKNDILYKSDYRVAGVGNIDRSLTRSAELNVKLSKNEYQSGDTIELAIDAPYTGTGLITIEKDKVYAWKWFHTKTTGTVQKITVPKNLKGNGYVNVQFIRGGDSDELFLSPLSYSVQPFKVKAVAETASLKIDAPKLIKPGEPMKISVTTTEPQKLVVYAVDEGILQVADYRFMNPLAYFFEKRRLQVKSFQIIDLIMPDFARFERLVSAAGGDELVAKNTLANQLNPFKRKVEKPVVYWSEMIEVKGKKTLSYTPPDYFNGTLRVMAVSVSENKIGAAQTQTTVRDDFVLTPNAPFVMSPGDQVDVTLNVSNNVENNGQSVPVAVTLVASPQLQVVGASTATLTLPEKAEDMARFTLKANEVLGNGTLQFKASYKDNHGKRFETTREATISVRPAMPARTQTLMSRMSGDSETIASLRKLYDAHAVNTAYLSYSPLVLTNGLTEYLKNYPHLCSEQLVSQAMASLVKNTPGAGKLKDTKVPEVIALLRSRTNSRGVIGMWYATDHDHPFLSNYAAQYLIEAKDRGANIPEDYLKILNRYLRENADDTHSRSLEGLRQRAFSAYLLTRQGEITTNALAQIQQTLQSALGDTWHSDPTAIYLAATYKMLKMDREADMLLKSAWSQLGKPASEVWWSRQYYDPLVVSAQAFYLISKHFPEKADLIPPQALENMVMMLRQNRYTTTSAAMSILALDHYGARVKRTNVAGEALSIDALVSDAKEEVKRISKFNQSVAFGDFPLNTEKLILKNSGTDTAWYAITQTGFDKTMPALATKNGLEVDKMLTDDAGRPVRSVRLGQTVNVVLRIRANTKEDIDNVAMVDLIPGGFEIVFQKTNTHNTDQGNEESDEAYDRFVSPIAVAPSDWRIDFTDAREDRAIIYGTATRSLQTFVYQIKPTNVGTYTIPPAFAEAMYDKEIQAMSVPTGVITVTPPE